LMASSAPARMMDEEPAFMRRKDGISSGKAECADDCVAASLR
jgi:hypothetical protein